MSEASMPTEVIALTLILSLIGGLIPILSNLKASKDFLRKLTGVASGILLASALILVIPEGFEIVAENHDEHGDSELAGSVAIVLLEVNKGDITPASGIEEIESLLEDNHDHDLDDSHEDDHDEDEEEAEASLAESIEHVIEEVEDGDIDASAGIAEIEEIVISQDIHEDEGAGIGVFLAGLAVLLGFCCIMLLEGFGIGHAVHEEHHDHESEHGHMHIHHRATPILVLLGLSLHSAADGLAIGSAAAGTSEAVTAAVALAVLIHKVPAAFSLGVFSLHERSERNDSIRDVVLFSIATPIMIVVSFYALEGVSSEIIALAMLFSGGTFLYVAAVDTLPDFHNPETGKDALFSVLIGIAIMSVILIGADLMGLMEHNH